MAKAFDIVQCYYVSQTMSKLGFENKMVDVIYWIYSDASSQCFICEHLSRPWVLGKLVRQGCPLSALLYAIATHPLLVYLDLLTKVGQLTGLQLPSPQPFIAHAFFGSYILYVILNALMNKVEQMHSPTRALMTRRLMLSNSMCNCHRISSCSFRIACLLVGVDADSSVNFMDFESTCTMEILVLNTNYNVY